MNVLFMKRERERERAIRGGRNSHYKLQRETLNTIVDKINALQRGTVFHALLNSRVQESQ